ncbi:MAG: sugar ABC transporter substrate-binding protein [Clostridiales bacterium]|nr:sugar ABC transporter substrate-binding protein [Clostridiales bacterium]
MRKKLVRFVTAIVSLIMTFSLFSGCGKKKSDTISIFIYGQSHELTIYKTLIGKFTEETGIKVDASLVASDGYAEKLSASLGSKNCPDVFYADPGAIAGYANNGLILPLNDMLEAEKESGGFNYNDYIDGVLDYYTYDVKTHTRGEGEIYAVPKDVSAYPMCYNRVVVQKAIDAGSWTTYASGIPYPWDLAEGVAYTWEQFEAVCKACTFTDNGKKYFGTGLIDTYAMHSWIWTAGGDYLTADNKQVNVNEPKFIEGLQRFIDLMDQKGVSPNRKEMSDNSYYNRWLAGEIAFFNCGVWDVGAFENVSESILDYYLMPAPRKDENSNWYSYIGTIGYTVSSNCANPEGALKLAMYMGLSEESYQRMSKRQVIQLPNNKNKVEEFLNDPDVKAPANRKLFYDVITGGHGKTYPTAFTYDATWYQKFIDGLSDCWKVDDNSTAKKTVSKYCADIQAEMQAELQIGINNELEGL